MRKKYSSEETLLGYSIQGKRGGNPHTKDDVGCIKAYIDNADNKCSNSISIDAFEGCDETYRRRSKCQINIMKDNNYVFTGTFDELLTKLTEK